MKPNLKRWIQVLFLCCFLVLMLFISNKKEVSILKADAIFFPKMQVKESNLPTYDTKQVVFEEPIIEEKKILFTGDSRFVGMSYIENDGEVFLAEVGKGFPYFCSLQDTIKNENADIVVVGFGANDLYSVEKYVEYLNSKPYSAEVYFLTVNPVDESIESKYGYTVTNEDIDEFNNYIKENAVSYKVLDTNSYLWSIGFETKDGLHYKDETYQNIYDFIINEIR